MPEDPLDALPPHEILEQIAGSASSILYRARDVVHERIVVLKVFNADERKKDEFPQLFHELRAAALVRHPHLLPLYAAGWNQGRPSFTMKLAVNGSLAERRGQFTDPRAAAGLVEKLTRAVAAAHAHGLIHRNLAPHRILFDENDQPLVGGFVKATRSKPSYSAPEQCSQQPDGIEAATDVWALGLILFELLTGKLPFDGAGDQEMIHAILTAEPVRPRRLCPDLDVSLEAVLLHCLEKKPDDRYPSARALADDLERWQRAEPTAARPETLTQRILRGLARPFRGKAP